MESCRTEATSREDRLFRTTAEARMEMIHLPVNEIEVRHNPRRSADVAAITRLGVSIARLGLLQPLTVSREGSGFVLVAGGRRLAAVKDLGWEQVPCVIARDDDPRLRRIRAGAENVAREPMSASEEASEIAAYMDELGLTLEEAAEAVGISTQTARERRLPLLALPEGVRSKVHSGEVGVDSAMKLVRVAERSPGLSADIAERLASGALERRAWEADPAAALAVVAAEEGDGDGALCVPFSEGTRLELCETARRVISHLDGDLGDLIGEEEAKALRAASRAAPGSLLEVTVTDATAAQGAGALVSYRRGPTTVDFLVDARWAAEWLCVEAKRAEVIETESAKGKEPVAEEVDAKAEREARAAATRAAQADNEEFGYRLGIELDHLREVPKPVADVIAGHVIDAYGTQMALGARLVRRKWWTRDVREMRSGAISGVTYRPLETDEAKRRLEEHVLAGETGAEVIGRLAAHLISAVGCDQAAVPPSQRRRIVLPYGGAGTAAARMGKALGEIAGKVLPKGRYEALREELGLGEPAELPDRRSGRQKERSEREEAARLSARREEELRERPWTSLTDGGFIRRRRDDEEPSGEELPFGGPGVEETPLAEAEAGE